MVRLRLDSMIFKVFSNLINSILWYTENKYIFSLEKVEHVETCPLCLLQCYLISHGSAMGSVGPSQQWGHGVGAARSHPPCREQHQEPNGSTAPCSPALPGGAGLVALQWVLGWVQGLTCGTGTGWSPPRPTATALSAGGETEAAHSEAAQGQRQRGPAGGHGGELR